LTDRPSEHLAFAGAFGGFIYEPPAVADALRRYQDTLRVHAVEDVAKAFAFLADEVLSRHPKAVEDEFVGRVVHHHPSWLHGEAFGFPQVDEEDGEAVGAFFDFGEGRGAGEQDHEVRLLDPGDVDLAPVHHVMVALARGHGPDRACVRPGLGLGDGEGLQPELTRGYLR
jgi:hypothetical protein